MTTRAAANRKTYRVLFLNQGQVYEVYARRVEQGTLFGFVVIEGLLFGERSSLVVDPAEEKIKTEFAGVQRFSLPMHAVIRIDEVEKDGVSRVAPQARGEGGTVSSFPAPIYGTPPKEPRRS